MCFIVLNFYFRNEPPHVKTNNVVVRPAKTQISLGIRRVWSESSLSAWSKRGSLATHCAHSEDSVQTGRMPRLIWVFAGRTATLLVLSWSSSFIHFISSRRSSGHYRWCCNNTFPPFPVFRCPQENLPTPLLSIPWCYLPISSSVFLFFLLLSVSPAELSSPC